jgi:glutamate N-acetyltransferase/amino-acid N-acetyltransferase
MSQSPNKLISSLQVGAACKLLKTPLPMGFSASGINSGVRRYRPDLGVIILDQPGVCSGVFTKSELKSASVKYCQTLLPAGNIKAIITNSGQANTATGVQGEMDNLFMAQQLAEKLNVNSDQILTASTGVIGVPLEIEKIVGALDELCTRTNLTAEGFAQAILTTDLIPKTVTMNLSLSTGTITLTGVAKGSGMIHPNMGTMLGYIMTDLVLNPVQSQNYLKNATNLSFNMISVDGDCSPNDAVFLISSGASDISVMTEDDDSIFQQALNDLCIYLAKSIASDGEGASKLIEVNLKGFPDEEQAKIIARDLVVSPLIKTAIHGADPNWGRILSRIGANGKLPVSWDQKIKLKIQNFEVFSEGRPTIELVQNDILRQKLKSDYITIDIDFFSGPFSATAWGCDLSKKYVEINGEYTT